MKSRSLAAVLVCALLVACAPRAKVAPPETPALARLAILVGRVSAAGCLDAAAAEQAARDLATLGDAATRAGLIGSDAT